jgi:hypothetical protein
MTIKTGMNSALTVAVIQRADTMTPMTMTKKRKMTVVIRDEPDPAPLLPRRPSGTAAAAAVAIAAAPFLRRRRFEARDYYVAASSPGEEERNRGEAPAAYELIDR